MKNTGRASRSPSRIFDQAVGSQSTVFQSNQTARDYQTFYDSMKSGFKTYYLNQISPSPVLEANPYFGIVKIDDFIPENPPFLIQNLCSCLLRYHSELKKWFKQLSSRSNFIEGSFFTLNTMHHFLLDCRIINGRLNLTNFNRLVKTYRMRTIPIFLDKAKIRKELEKL